MPERTVKSPGRARARSPEDVRQLSARRLYAAGAALLGVVAVGTTGYHVIGDGRWSWFDCLYMTVITVATVGYGETLEGLPESPFGRQWTMLLILFGSGTLLYFVSMLTAFVVEGDLRGALRRTRMQRKIDDLSGHVVLCGGGSTGEWVAGELASAHASFVVIEQDRARIADMLEWCGPDLLYIQGDATDDDVLERAGIRRASGVVTALHEDRDNVFVTITARALNDKARIVAKAVESSAEAKLRRAGANAVVSPNAIGGMRLASELLRPTVVQFLDAMVRDPDHPYRIESVEVPKGSPVAGLKLRDAKLYQRADVVVIAIRGADGKHRYNPSPDEVLPVGAHVVVLADSEHLARLRAALGA